MSLTTRYQPRHRASADPEIVPGGRPEPAIAPTNPGEDPGVDPGPPGPDEEPAPAEQPLRAVRHPWGGATARVLRPRFGS